MSNVDSCGSAVAESGSIADKAPPYLSKCHQEEEGSQNRTKTNNNGSISRRLKKGRVAELSSRFDCPPDRVVVRVRRNRIEEVKVCRAPSTARSFRNASKMNESSKTSADAKRKPSFRRTPGKVREAVRKLENFKLQEKTVPEKVEPKEVKKLDAKPQVVKDNKLEEIRELKQTSKYGKLYEKLRLKPTAKVMKKPMTLPKPDLKTLENSALKNGKTLFLNIPPIHKNLQTPNIKDKNTSSISIEDKENQNNLLLSVVQEKPIESQESEQSPRVPPRPFMENTSNTQNSEDALYTNLSNECSIKQDISDEDRLYQEIKSRIKPNQSFLFRSISQTNDVYMNLVEIDEQQCDNINKSVNNSDSVNNSYNDIYLSPKPNSLNNSKSSVHTSNLSVDNSIETLNEYEGVVLRRDLASRNVDNEYDECQDVTIVKNIKNGSVYSERHLYQRLSDCSSKLYDHLNYKEHNYEVCNEPLPPRNGLSTNIRHSNLSESSDERVCSLYETIPAATIDCEGNFS